MSRNTLPAVGLESVRGRSRRALVRASVVLVGALCAVLPTSALATHASATQRQLVPAYFYPDGTNWQAMCSAMASPGTTGSVAIMNPASGPGKRANQDYARVLEVCQGQGQKVVGYVHTSYGSRSLRLVRGDIDAYYRYYPAIDGIFLDEMSNNRSATEAYYRNLYSHIKSKPVGRNRVIGNPGAAASTPWQLQVADNVVVFEGTAGTYSSWRAPDWTLAQPADAISHLVHTASEPAMHEACEKSQWDNAGFVYVTDDVLSNPWDTLPPYWTSHVTNC